MQFCFTLAKITKDLLGGRDPSTLDPALANPRLKRKVIQDLKKESAPLGSGIRGEQQDHWKPNIY